MDENKNHQKVIDILIVLKNLSLITQLEILMNVFVMLSISNMDIKEDVINIRSISDFEKYLLQEISKGKDSLAIALGKQAILINIWLSNIKSK